MFSNNKYIICKQKNAVCIFFRKIIQKMECGPQLKPEEPEYPDIPKVSYWLGVQIRDVYFKNPPPPHKKKYWPFYSFIR